MFYRRVSLFSLLALLTAAHAAEPPLAERLVSPIAEVRDDAVMEFRRLPASVRERFVPSLMVAMGDENPYIRDQAASLLKELGVDARPGGPTPPTPVSADIIQARDTERKRAIADIQSAKTDRYQNLKSTLEAEKQTQPDWMSMRSSPGNQSDLKNTLLAGLGDPDPLMRSRSARRLGMLHPTPTEALPLLEQMLRDKDADCRASAAIALSSFGSAARGLSTPLGSLLNDPDMKVRIAAQEALRQIQGQP